MGSWGQAALSRGGNLQSSESQVAAEGKTRIIPTTVDKAMSSYWSYCNSYRISLAN